MSNKLAAENSQLRDSLVQLLAAPAQSANFAATPGIQPEIHRRKLMHELIECIFETLSESSQMEVVTLCLIDSDYDIRRIMSDLSLETSDFQNLLFLIGIVILASCYRHYTSRC